MTGLYVHIPFCVRKCNYCDFYSVAIGENNCYRPGLDDSVSDDAKYRSGLPDVEQYITGIINEIKNAPDHKYETVFIGGGTPSVLSVEQMRSLLSAIRDKADPNEFTIECNSGTVTADKLKLYKEYGINRLSIGCQSLNDNELRILGRIHLSEDFYKTYEMAVGAGFDNISVDLMSAIPEQTVESFKKSLDGVIKLNPKHISVYSLIIEPGTPFYELYKDRPPVDEETDREIYELTYQTLEDAGYLHYEVSNYAKYASTDRMPGDVLQCKTEEQAFVSRHNLNYWRRGSYFGVGPTAASFDREMGPYGTRWVNAKFDGINKKRSEQDDVGENENSVENNSEQLTKEQALIETVYLGLRTCEGISCSEIYDEFDVDVRGLWEKEINEYVSRGLARDERRLVLTDEGMFVSDSIIDRLIGLI